MAVEIPAPPVSRASPEGSEIQLSSAQCCVVFPVAMAGIKMGAREGGRREESGQEKQSCKDGRAGLEQEETAKGGIPVLFGSILVMVF